MKNIKNWVTTHKTTATAIALAVAIALLGIGFAVVQLSNHAPDKPASKSVVQVETTKPDEPVDVPIDVKASDSWTGDSSPVILHVESKGEVSDGKGNEGSVNFYHAVNKTDTAPKVKLAPGTYDVTVISPVNNDGSLEVSKDNNPEKKTVHKVEVTVHPVEPKASEDAPKDDKTDKPKQSIEVPMENVPAKDVTDDQVKAINEAVKDAITHGDETLKGETGQKAIDKIAENVQRNATVSEDTKAETQETTAESKDETASAPVATTPAKPKADNSNSGSSASTPKSNNNGGNDNSNKSTATAQPAPQPAPKPAHEHTWEKRQRWVPNLVTKTIVDEPARTERVFHFVVEFYHDGYRATSEADALAHQDYLFDNGYNDGFMDDSYYETVNIPAKTHTETVDEGHYESYWVCTSCGATK